MCLFIYLMFCPSLLPPAARKRVWSKRVSGIIRFESKHGTTEVLWYKSKDLRQAQKGG